MESRLGSLENYTVITAEQEKMVIDFSERDASCVKDWLSKVYCGNDQVDVFPQPSLPSSIDKANGMSSRNGEVNGHTNGHYDIDELELASKMISLSKLDFKNPANDFAENVFDKGKKKSKKSRKRESKSAFDVYSQHTIPTNGSVIARYSAEAYSGPCQTSKMERFAKIVYGKKPSIVFTKLSILDV